MDTKARKPSQGLIMNVRQLGDIVYIIYLE